MFSQNGYIFIMSIGVQYNTEVKESATLFWVVTNCASMMQRIVS